ncbi:MAG: response regulator [Myxococcota bacterium]
MRILLVEDDPISMEVLAQILSERGHVIERATCAETGLEMAKRERFPLVITDWVLPQMSGLELCRQLRKLPGGDKTIILVMTARENDGDVDLALDAGATDWFNKPFERLRLATRLTVAERAVVQMQVRQHLEESLRRSETMSALGTLVADVAHEIRNPLFGISATLDAFEVQYGAQKDFEEYTTVLRGEVERMTQLIQHLVDYGRPAKPVVSPIVAERVLLTAVDGLMTMAELAGIHLNVTMHTQEYRVNVDDEQLRRVFENLITNAVHFSPQGGCIDLTAQIREEQDGLWIEWAVRDHGPGFAPERISIEVFRPFFHAAAVVRASVWRLPNALLKNHQVLTAANHPQGERWFQYCCRW